MWKNPSQGILQISTDPGGGVIGVKPRVAAVKFPSNFPFAVFYWILAGKAQTFIQTHRSPPQGISVGSKLLVELVLHKVDKEWREDENQEADVPGGYQLLRAEVKTEFQRSIMDFENAQPL